MNTLELFKKQMIKINEESNVKTTELISDIIEQEVSKTFKEKYNQHIEEIIEDRMKIFEYTQKKAIENVHDRINQAGEYFVELEKGVESKLGIQSEETGSIKSKTDTLEFNGRSEELRKYIHNKIYKSTGIESGSIEDTLFFGKLNRKLQGEIKGKYNVVRYGLLLIDDLGDCKKLIDTWFPPSNYKSRYMQEHRMRNDKNSLPCSLKKAYNKYLDLHGGVI